MRKEDAELLIPGETVVQIGDRLLGEEIYGYGDPTEYKKYLGTIGVVTEVRHTDPKAIFVKVEGCEDASFIIEEISHIVSGASEVMDEIPEDDFFGLLGGIA